MSSSPTTGNSTNTPASGSTRTARIATAVPASVRSTVASTPNRAPSQPQANFPAAPPMNTSASAWPIVESDAPCSCSRNGRKVRNPMRTLESSIPTASSSANPPRAPDEPCAVFVSDVDRPQVRRQKDRNRHRNDDAKRGDRPQHVMPGHQRQQQRSPARNRGLADIAGEIVGAERTTCIALIGARDRSRCDRVLRESPHPTTTSATHSPMRPAE